MTYFGALNIQEITRNQEDYREYRTNGKQIKFAIKEHDILKWKPSVFESRANLYAYGFLVDNELKDVTVFWMAELQNWLKQYMQKYRLIKDTLTRAPGGDYEVEFVSVPLGDIPHGIICNINSLIENKK